MSDSNQRPDPVAVKPNHYRKKHVVEAMQLVGTTSEKTVDRAIKAGDLPVKFVGRKPLVPFPALVAWFEGLPDEKPE
jgi:hypothetical protein